MFFHWLKLYGKRAGDATGTIDTVFADAAAAYPAIFAGDSSKEPERQAKFEYMSPWLALALLEKSEAESRKLLEVMVDRLEVGLREGGVGDMKVGVHVRKYAAALHGRVRRYASLLERKDWDGLALALGEHGVDTGLAAKLKAALKK